MKLWKIPRNFRGRDISGDDPHDLGNLQITISPVSHDPLPPSTAAEHAATAGRGRRPPPHMSGAVGPLRCHLVPKKQGLHWENWMNIGGLLWYNLV